MKKYGTGEVIPDEDDEQRKVAAANWSEKDQEELHQEFTEDDA